MAFEQHIDLNDYWFCGEDKTLTLTIYQPGTTLAQIAAGTAVVQNLTGWTIDWVMREEDTSTGAAVLTKTATISTPANGIAIVAIADTDTDALTPRKYRQAWKRTNEGNEGILAIGDAWLRQAPAR